MPPETKYLPTKKVLQRYGISAMSLWRWEHDAALPFPAPLIINRRKFYELPAIEAWERARAAAASAGSLARVSQSASDSVGHVTSA